jgi:hypothetical protein
MSAMGRRLRGHVRRGVVGRKRARAPGRSLRPGSLLDALRGGVLRLTLRRRGIMGRAAPAGAGPSYGDLVVGGTILAECFEYLRERERTEQRLAWCRTVEATVADRADVIRETGRGYTQRIVAALDAIKHVSDVELQRQLMGFLRAQCDAEKQDMHGLLVGFNEASSLPPGWG